MKNIKTGEITPSLTFMPRAMEFESYSNEELWRTADPDETYLDPAHLLLSKKELRREKRQLTRQRRQEKYDKKVEMKKGKKAGALPKEAAVEMDYDSVSSYTSDSEYNEQYEQNLRDTYKDPTQYTRDRDFARKYALSTTDLIYRYLTKVTASEILEDDSTVPSILTRLYLDDFWQLLSELRLELDHIDGDLGAELHLRLLESVGVTIRQNVGWMRSTLQELREWNNHLKNVTSQPPELASELADLTAELQDLHARTEQTLNFVIASTGISQSTLVIDQTSGINKLTELAFFFVPLSFITSVFSMQVYELTEAPPKIWVWGLCLALIFIATYIIRSIVRSPSMRLFAMKCRVIMLNRFTPSQATSASRRLHTVGNRAIFKFIFFLVSITTLFIAIVGLFLGILFLLFGGLLAGVAITAIYFIVTRWGELQVVIPCFISLGIAALGTWASYYWLDEISATALALCNRCLYAVKDLFPARWTFDGVDDEDLQREGYETYGRQAVLLATA